MPHLLLKKSPAASQTWDLASGSSLGVKILDIAITHYDHKMAVLRQKDKLTKKM